jgi:hypothetical protein
MDPNQVRTLGVLIATGLIVGAWLIAYDVWTYRKYGNESTISFVTMKLAHEWPALPFLFGLIGGALAAHFFWSQGAAHVLHEERRTRSRL